jgi:hypothetical protein
MALDRAFDQQPEAIARAQVQRVAANGSEADSHLARLLEQNGPRCGSDLADAVHLLCALHGHHPGLIAIAAANHCTSDSEREWLSDAVRGFEDERAFLLRLTAAVGPIPGTPGAAETESSLAAMRHALDTLGHSERSGCALGAACALVADWGPVRRVLDRAAARCTVQPPKESLPVGSLLQVIGEAARSPAAARALAFGSEQMLLQHRALFALLEARSEARAALY